MISFNEICKPTIYIVIGILVFFGASSLYPKKTELADSSTVPAIERSYFIMSRDIFEQRTNCGHSKSQFTYLSFKMKNISIAVVKKMNLFSISANNFIVASGSFYNLNSALNLSDSLENENRVNGAGYNYIGTEKYGSYSNKPGTNLKLFCSNEVCNFTIILHDNSLGLPSLQKDAQHNISFYENEILLEKIEMPAVPSTPPEQNDLYAPVDVSIEKNEVNARAFIPVDGTTGAMRITWQDDAGDNEEVFLFENGKSGMEIKNKAIYTGSLNYAAALLYYQLPNNHSYERKVVVRFKSSTGLICSESAD